ncbi:MAG: Ig-like domain repeat protein, partial [Oscillospiraceae bacterium]|nr:Ig-like domain repeat protein [Oscillospiraceae bacterium]
ESHKDANGIYYDEQRTARVTIMDETFTNQDNETVKDFEQFVVEILKTYGAEPQILSDWTFQAAEDGKGGTWTRTYTYGVKSNDAKRDGDNYQATVAVTDKAGNTSATDTQGAITRNNVKDEKEPSHYTSANGELFTVDQTAPVVSVSFNNNNVRNGKYFNAARTATITVVEHNFDPARVTLVATGASAGAAAAEGWSQNGDTWTKTVTFGRDANCKFSIDVVDKAGNVCPNANVRYSGAATADFVIDMTRPNVQYTGVDASPYGEACTPGFTATDTNLGNEFTYKLSRKTMKGEEDVSNLLNHAGSAARFSYSDIPNSRDDDGIYTFTCSVTDLAGNVTTLNPVEFAVNRHGSVYLLNKELQNVVGKYFNEEGWAKVDDGNLVITEYNPTPLKDDAKLEIYRDGTRVATYTGDALKKLVSGGDRGGLGLYEYAYKLPAADFAEDGSYRVVLSSTDANDHKSGNDKTGAEINFVIDTVSPEIVSISGLEKRTVNAEEQPVGFHILDTYGLDSVAIRTAGPDGAIVKEYISQAKYDAQNGKLEPYQQLLPEGELDLTDEIILIQNNTPYHVVISVTDKAGNTTVADGGSIVSSTEAEAMTPSYDFQDSVTVSTNFFVRYIHNTGALIGTGVGAAALAGLWLVLAKRKKDDEEKKTA